VRACKSRGTKGANEVFIAIAVIVTSLEVMARDFARWGKRFPDAKHHADKVLNDGAMKQESN
jgi:hypothetical protein